ncbi:matrixin family metalloprotease [Paenibacillus ferrarius]|uniref:matrixin family metalloprotease n=1 Tax=Paenibacillus ferrarius TaxID=1469647 RepID=UPI003D27478F
MKAKKTVTVILTSVIGLTVGVSSAWAYGTISSGISSPPLTFTKWNGFDPATYTAFSNAASPWNVVSQGEIGKNIIDPNGTTTSTNSYPVDDYTNLITKGDRGLNQYLMQTTTYKYIYPWIDNHTLHADIDINGSFAWSNNQTSGTYDVQNVITHEFGHAAGLADLYGTGDTEKTMYGYSSTDETKKRTLDTDDINGIKALY